MWNLFLDIRGRSEKPAKKEEEPAKKQWDIPFGFTYKDILQPDIKNTPEKTIKTTREFTEEEKKEIREILGEEII